MVKYTRKGTPVKNNAYKYGMLGEKYVQKHIHCPRCYQRLIRLPANNPGTDFKCKNGHYFQLKFTQIVRLRAILCHCFLSQIDHRFRQDRFKNRPRWNIVSFCAVFTKKANLTTIFPVFSALLFYWVLIFEYIYTWQLAYANTYPP